MHDGIDLVGQQDVLDEITLLYFTFDEGVVVGFDHIIVYIVFARTIIQAIDVVEMSMGILAYHVIDEVGTNKPSASCNEYVFHFYCLLSNSK
jgi:hypothetical protein